MARNSTSATKSQVEDLKRANEQLKAENIRLKARLGGKKTFFWRGLVITLCAVLAVALLMAGNVLFWAGSTLINTDKYVATVQPLAANKNIQFVIANRTTTQVFKQVNVQAAITGVLPPRADFLAPQLTSQLRGTTEKTLQKTLASPKFQTLWVNVNRNAQQKLVNTIKSSKTTDGTINLQDVYGQLSQSLKDTKLGFLANKTLPDKIGSIAVINAPWIPKARFVVNNIGWLKPTTLALVAVFSACAIWLARNRRRTVIALAGIFAVGMATTLIAMQIIQNRAADHVQPAYHAAASDAAGIILQPLGNQSWAILAFSALVMIIAWLTGPYRWARCTTSATRSYLTTPVHNLAFGSENDFTRWLSANRQTMEWVIVAVVGLIMLLVQLSLGLVALYGAVMLVSVLVIETLAAPHSPHKR